MEKIKKILILDDSKEFVDLLKRLLSSEKIHITTSIDTANGLDEIKQTEYNLIITDYLIDELNGLDFSRVVREGIVNKLTPIILMTAKELDEIELSKVKKYELNYFKKPIFPRSLRSQILEILK